jgi:hypothetical protein
LHICHGEIETRARKCQPAIWEININLNIILFFPFGSMTRDIFMHRLVLLRGEELEEGVSPRQQLHCMSALQKRIHHLFDWGEVRQMVLFAKYWQE